MDQVPNRTKEQVRKMSREEKLMVLDSLEKDIKDTNLKLKQLNREAYKVEYELGYYAKKEILYGVKYDPYY